MRKLQNKNYELKCEIIVWDPDKALFAGQNYAIRINTIMLELKTKMQVK